jgi:hypothetical protein
MIKFYRIVMGRSGIHLKELAKCLPTNHKILTKHFG